MPHSFLRLLPERLAMALLAIILAALLFQIGARLCGISLNWVQEFITLVFVWFVFFCIAAAYCRTEHMAVDFIHTILTARLGKKARTAWLLGIESLQMTVMSVIAIGLFLMVIQSWSLRAGSMPEFRIGYLYLGVFFAVAISIAAQGGNVIASLRNVVSS